MSEAFLKVVNMSISAGWLVLAVLALRLILKKAPKWVNVLLWGIVAIRLICPFSIESALSLIPSTETISPEIMMDWTPEISTGIEPLDQVVNPVISTSFAPQGMASANPLQILIPVAANLWLLGVLILLAYTAISYLTLRYKLRTAIILRDNIFQCETVSSPFVLGILKPRIYLAYAMDGKNLRHVVAHEKAHIRRKDHWWKPLGFLLLTVYWFNPLMWVAYILLCRDIELACDEKVIAELGNDQRADYTQALVTCAVNRRMIAACPLAFGEVGVKDRVKCIMNYRKPTFWIIVTALVVCVAVAVCFLTDPNPSREFSMSGENVSNLNPEAIVERILDIENIDNSGVYMNSMNFSLQVDSNFNWADSQAVSYFFKKSKSTYKGQLRIFPNEKEYFLTEPSEGQEQQSIFLLRHYLEAVKYLPQEAIRQMAPADQYIIQHREEGRPSDYERVITYSSDAVQPIDGWYIHLQIQPLQADGGAFSGTGEEVIELFYGSSNGKYSDYAEMWFDFTAAMQKKDYTHEMKCTKNEFPGITFKYTPYEIVASTSWEDDDAAERTVLISGMPIWNAYFSDLTGDGLPEICSQVSFGSGIIDSRVIIYDYANGVSYNLIDRGNYDYCLRMNDADGYLYVDKYVYNTDELASSGRLVFKNDTLQLEEVSSNSQVYPDFSGKLNLGLNAEIIDVDYDQRILYVKDIDESAAVFGDRCAIDCSYAISCDNLIFVNYSEFNDVRAITFEDFEVGDSVIISMYDSEKDRAFNSSAIAEQIQLGTQKFTNIAQSDMEPTRTNLRGFYGGYLFVPINGSTFRYEMTNIDPNTVNAGYFLLTFTEETHIEGIVWEVYSLKEYPDMTKVLAISGTNSAWVCEYAPAMQAEEGALEAARDAGYVIVENGYLTDGNDAWKEFYNKTQEGKLATIYLAHYYTLDPDRTVSTTYEALNQDYPALYILELSYDGDRFVLRTESDVKVYEHLMMYLSSGTPLAGNSEHKQVIHYVLTHDTTHTWEELWGSLASSVLGAAIDHYTICTEQS